ncbi:hypothetical protein F5B20DRAFT_548093 [Whalleya microplaca]|nr:hypothetical protein F5B20DRAFT_548093 [Whalleya microplaca]
MGPFRVKVVVVVVAQLIGSNVSSANGESYGLSFRPVDDDETEKSRQKRRWMFLELACVSYNKKENCGGIRYI